MPSSIQAAAPGVRSATRFSRLAAMPRNASHEPSSASDLYFSSDGRSWHHGTRRWPRGRSPMINISSMRATHPSKGTSGAAVGAPMARCRASRIVPEQLKSVEPSPGMSSNSSPARRIPEATAPPRATSTVLRIRMRPLAWDGRHPASIDAAHPSAHTPRASQSAGAVNARRVSRGWPSMSLNPTSTPSASTPTTLTRKWPSFQPRSSALASMIRTRPCRCSMSIMGRSSGSDLVGALAPSLSLASRVDGAAMTTISLERTKDGHNGHKVARLRSHPLLASCSWSVVRRVASLADEVAVDAGEVWARQGETPKWFVVIQDGQAEVVRDGVRLAVLGPGACFGEIPLLVRSAHPATIRALTPMTGYGIHAQYFVPLVDDVRRLREGLGASLARQPALVELALEDRRRQVAAGRSPPLPRVESPLKRPPWLPRKCIAPPG